VKRKVSVVLLLTLVGSLTFCWSLSYWTVDPFTTFNDDLTSLTDQIVTAINENPTPAGVDEARKLLSAKKPGLQEELAHLKKVSAARSGGKALKEFGQGIIANRAKLEALLTRLLQDHHRTLKHDDPFLQSLSNLGVEYSALFD